MRFLVVGLVLGVSLIGKSFALRCWKCSSDLDPSCGDPFNEYNNRNYRQNGVYDNSQQNYNGRQYDNSRQYDNNNYNNRYDNRYQNRDPSYNSGGGLSNYNPGFNSFNRAPELQVCDEAETRNGRMRNVCLKKIVRGSAYTSIVRRCELIPYEQTTGTCSQNDNRGFSLDFCEYCDWDGCNSATGLKTNIYLAAAISTIVLFFYH